VTAHQALAFAMIAIAVGLFAWGRFRYDVVALGALLAAVAVGDVPAKEAFTGFTSDVVIVIASALVVSAAVSRSGIIEILLRPLLPRLRTASSQVPALAGATALLSMPTKNVGALAILMPVALRTARETGTSPSSLLMPMSFMSLLGGLVTLVGTSTNILVSQVRQETLGRPFEMFDFAPVGLALTAAGLVFVSVGWRLLPRNRQGSSGLDGAMAAAPYSTDAVLPDPWPGHLKSLSDLQLLRDKVQASALLRDGRTQKPLPDSALRAGDILVLQGDQDALDRVFARLPLEHVTENRPVEKDTPSEEMRSVEAVILDGSPLVGASAQRMALQQAYGVNLIAVGRSRERITERLRDLILQAGDVLVLQAGERALPKIMHDLGVLPLAERTVKLGEVRSRFLPAAILTVAMLLVAFKVTPVAMAFFGAAVMMVVTGALTMREAYESLEPEVLILIGALTPLSEAVRHTGGADLIGQALAAWLHPAPPLLALVALMVAAMACSPFLHNAPTVLVLAPIGVALARGLHLNPDPFLMAVATGAGCDFLTPIGHQCNTLVMGPGGYRFSDYWRLGLPLSILVIGVGAPLIAHVWPLLLPP